MQKKNDRFCDPGYYTEDGLALSIQKATSDPAFPQYGYGIVQGAALAGSLGYEQMSVIELGVAGGNGLVAMENLANHHSDSSGVEICVSGFDLGSGMPEPLDYRDLPYIWQPNFFQMDEALLRQNLKRAELHIGDIAETGPQFLNQDRPPLGFISFDLDYYSSTISAFNSLLYGASENYLPRTICYFDDTVGPHHEMHSEFTGELLAIKEFNDANEKRKLGRLNGLNHKISPNNGPWIEGIYVFHVFDHPQYNEYIYPVQDRQFNLDV